MSGLMRPGAHQRRALAEDLSRVISLFPAYEAPSGLTVQSAALRAVPAGVPSGAVQVCMYIHTEQRRTSVRRAATSTATAPSRPATGGGARALPLALLTEQSRFAADFLVCNHDASLLNRLSCFHFTKDGIKCTEASISAPNILQNHFKSYPNNKT